MQDERILCVNYNDFKNGAIEKRELESIVFKYALENPRYFGIYFKQKDECADFLCFIYPRISRAIDRFDLSLGNFDTFINGSIRRAYREYMLREQTCYEKEDYVWKEEAYFMHVAEEEPLYCSKTDDNDIYNDNLYNHKSEASIRKTFKYRKKLLILLLKSYYFITDDLIYCIAPYLDLEPEEIIKKLDEIRSLRSQRDTEIFNLRERCFTQHFRCRNFETRLANYVKKNGTDNLMLNKKIEKSRQRLLNMRSRLNKMRHGPSNSQIAGVLGLSKGTVDSCMYFSKHNKEKYIQHAALLQL
jgi:hypothetical protein